MEDLIPGVAAALGELRRSPGGDEAWAERIIPVLERERPACYNRLRRRLGFARKLASLADLSEREEAVLSVGLLFYQLAEDAGHGETPRRAWLEYFLAHAEWLAPCFEVALAVQAPEWGEADSRPAVIAKVAVLFDSETLEHQARSFEVLQTLRSESTSAGQAAVVELLWSEEGQGLCDYHVRRRDYSLDAKALRRGLELLKPALAARPGAEPALAPMRLSGITRQRAEPALEPVEDTVPLEAVASENFERRRQALRSAASNGGTAAVDEVVPASPPPPPPAPAEPEAEPPSEEEAPANVLRESPIRQRLRAAERAAEEEATPPAKESRPRLAPVPVEDEEEDEPAIEVSAAPVERPYEEEAMTISSISAARERRENPDISEKLEALRSQLKQIQRIAVEGEELLASLTPQLEELSEWMEELDAVITRRKRRDGPAERAA